MLCVSWNAYKFLYCIVFFLQQNRVKPGKQVTSSDTTKLLLRKGGLLRRAQAIIEWDHQCPKRYVWTDDHLEQYQCYWERNKGDAENHKVTFREQNSLVFRLTNSTSFWKVLKESLSKDKELWFQCSPLESGNMCLYTGNICQNTETFLIWSPILYIFRFETQTSYIKHIQKRMAFSNIQIFCQGITEMHFVIPSLQLMTS